MIEIINLLRKDTFSGIYLKALKRPLKNNIEVCSPIYPGMRNIRINNASLDTNSRPADI